MNMRKNMRIAQVAPFGLHPYSGGSAIVELAIALANAGNQVEMWQLHEWDREATAEPTDRLMAAGVRLIRIPFRGSALTLGSPARAAVGSRKVDIAHLHGVFSPQNNLLARHLRVPFVHSPHGGYAPESLAYHSLRKVVFRRLFELPMLNRARALCALTEVEANEIRNFGVRSGIEVIPHGIEHPPADVNGKRFRTEVGLDSSDRLAIYIGRLDVRGKRLDVIVDGLGEAADWHVAFVGGDYRGGRLELEERISSRGLVDRAHMIGPRHGLQLHEALAAGDLLLLLSRSEGLPMSVLEGLSHAIPAVVSPEVNRRIPIGEAGWVVQPHELGALLGRLSDAPNDEWAAKQGAARKLASRYEWPAVAQSYMELYHRVVR
jgi:glycosyltransferase involved in cell wall biosynthesis